MTIFDAPNGDQYTSPPEMVAIPISERSFARSFEIANDMNLYILIGTALTTIVGILLTRATLVASKARPLEFAMANGAITAVVGIVANLSVALLLIALFLKTVWYWPVLIFVLATVISGIAINGRNAWVVYRLSTLLGIAVTAMTGALIWMLWVH